MGNLFYLVVMKSIIVDFMLVVYGNSDTVPELTEEDSPLFVKWYIEALDDIEPKVNIEPLNGSLYRVSWNEDPLLDELMLSDPDPFGSHPFEIKGLKYMVVGQIIL